MRVRSTLLGIALVLAAGCGGGDAPGSRSPQERGAQLYAMHCASCHQRDGRGLGEVQPTLAGSVTATGDPRALISWVLRGEPPATLVSTRSAVVMPQFAWLSDEDLALVLTHIRSSFGNAAGAIKATDVAAVRAAAGSER